MWLTCGVQVGGEALETWNVGSSSTITSGVGERLILGSLLEK